MVILLSVVDTATAPQALDDLPGYRLHPLNGDLKGYRAVTVRANWRIVFRFKDGDALDVELVDKVSRQPVAEAASGLWYPVSMKFAGTVLYVDEVPAVVDFYRRAFGFDLRFFDETLGFAELGTGGSILAIAAHSLGERLMPGEYSRPADGRPAGVEIAIFTADVSASFAKAIAEGAAPIAAPKRMPWGLEVAYVRAPEGTMIGFSEPPPAPAT